MTIPFEFTQGEKVTWDLPGSVNYANESITNANYNCKYYLRSANTGGLTVTGTNKADGWTFVITSTETASLISGEWHYQAFALKTDNSDQKELDNGTLTIKQSLIYTGNSPVKVDLRTDAVKMLELVEAALKAILTNKAAEYTIGDRTFKYIDLKELRFLRGQYKFQVNREQRVDKIRQGKGDPFINKLIFR